MVARYSMGVKVYPEEDSIGEHRRERRFGWLPMLSPGWGCFVAPMGRRSIDVHANTHLFGRAMGRMSSGVAIVGLDSANRDRLHAIIPWSDRSL